MPFEQFSAQLFLRLAEFVVWAEQHRDIAARYPELARLHDQSAQVLAAAARE
ncbi:MAG: hypothetical protein IT158_17615 [Bryobacterales bacterium]|nr:hypothetical protein [Bryobacterales bacterium]